MTELRIIAATFSTIMPSQSVLAGPLTAGSSRSANEGATTGRGILDISRYALIQTRRYRAKLDQQRCRPRSPVQRNWTRLECNFPNMSLGACIVFANNA